MPLLLAAALLVMLVSSQRARLLVWTSLRHPGRASTLVQDPSGRWHVEVDRPSS